MPPASCIKNVVNPASSRVRVEVGRIVRLSDRSFRIYGSIQSVDVLLHSDGNVPGATNATAGLRRFQFTVIPTFGFRRSVISPMYSRPAIDKSLLICAGGSQRKGEVLCTSDYDKGNALKLLSREWHFATHGTGKCIGRPCVRERNFLRRIVGCDENQIANL